MKNKPQKMIVILGQTSTGKSDFAVEIARKISGEIISADSRQVYKGMDLGTGKITKKEMRNIPHYLLDITSPSKIFSVSDFQKLAKKKLEEIISKNKTPIICGGTGFYIDSIVKGTSFPKVPPNKKLRMQLYPKSAIALFGYLEKLDPVRAKNIDPKNKVRLIRAREIAKALGKVPQIQNSPILTQSDTFSAMAENVSLPTINKQDLAQNKLEVLQIGLTLPPEVLKERIKTRLLTRIKKGMIEEVENLHKDGISWKRMEALGLEYRYVSLYLQNKLTKEEMIKKLNTEIWHFAKRQKTWFKRDQNIIWIDPRKNSDKNKAMGKIKKFLK